MLVLLTNDLVFNDHVQMVGGYYIYLLGRLSVPNNHQHGLVSFDPGRM
jgi:hypothetical protein